jgi:hypothetical protein
MEKKKPGALSELWRKFLVALKRRPQNIALVSLVITFLFYALNLMYISDTTAKIQGTGMGLCGFCVMLFSMLSFMCFINAFPYRKKPNVPMIVLPVCPGRNLSVVIEVAAMNNRQKRMGYNTAEEFNKRLMESIGAAQEL